MRRGERRSNFVDFRELRVTGAWLSGVKELHAELCYSHHARDWRNLVHLLCLSLPVQDRFLFLFFFLHTLPDVFFLAINFQRDGPSIISQGRLFHIKMFLLLLAVASLSYCIHPLASHLKAPLLLVLTHLEYLSASILVIASLAPLIPALVVCQLLQQPAWFSGLRRQRHFRRNVLTNHRNWNLIGR